MRTITDTVRGLLHNDEVAREASRRGILNSSAYAREILPRVQDATWKEVEQTSITVSVNRVSQESQWEPLRPELEFERISVETGLVDVTFERTTQLREILSVTVPEIRKEFSHDLFIETSGQHQITMVMSRQIWQALSQHLSLQPLGLFENQVALCLSFHPRYLTVPNFIYSVLGIFALQAINIIEIFSTMTEITIIIDSKNLDTALTQIKPYMK